MSPIIEQPLNERVAALEPQLEDLKADVLALREFKDSMIKEFAALTAAVKTLSWKVSLITGAVVVLLNQLASWGFRKLLP